MSDGLLSDPHFQDWAMQLPNLPVQPRNGMIRTYDNTTRTFSRPYSAKTVFFYKEGDTYFSGLRVPISKSRYKTIDGLLDDLNRNIQMPFGVRRLTTPMGRTPIDDINKLEHLGKYVASSSKTSRGVDFSALERLQKARETASESLRNTRPGGQSFWVSTSPSYQQKLRMTRTLGLSIPSKQVFFVLNGKGKFYRTLLNPYKLPSMEKLLGEVSEGLEVAIYRLYTTEGSRVTKVEEIMSHPSPKIIACPRNERPFLQAPVQLPLIRPSRYAPRLLDLDSLSNTNTTESIGENGIEKSTRTVMPPITKGLRRATGAPRKTFAERAFEKKKPVGKPKDALVSRKRHVVDSFELEKQGAQKTDDVDSGTGNSATSTGSWSHWDNERADSMTERKAQMIREESQAATSEEDLIVEGESDLDDHPRKSSATTDSAVGSVTPPRTSSAKSRTDTPALHTPNSRLSRASFRSQAETPALKTPDSATRNSLASSRSHADSPAMRTPDSEANFSARRASDTSEHSVAATSAVHTPDSSREITTPEANDRRFGHLGASTDSDMELEVPSTSGSVQTRDEERDQKPLRKITEEPEVMCENVRNAAATKIQAVYRGYRTRRVLKVRFNESNEEIPNLPSSQQPLEETADDFTVIENDEGRSLKSTNSTRMTYTIEVKIGFRYGAETEADLYVVLHGDEASSQKIVLRQESDWLLIENPQFREDQVVRFHVESLHLGTLSKIVIGHDSKGYGAGVFIEYAMVAENALASRQFMFFCNKWLDGGQVDGKIERTLFLSTFLYMEAALRDSDHTKGRWEFIVHTRHDGLGGTSSNLVIVGYGVNGVSMSYIENDRMFSDPAYNPLIQVDFGEIGELFKVRFEIDGAGDRPNYFIEYLEIRDLDTEERMAVSVNKWLMTNPPEDAKRYQAFREVPIYRATSQPLPTTIYEGKVTLADLELARSPQLKAQLIGATSDSGVFPIFPSRSKDKTTYSYKVDCVHLGNITDVRIIGDLEGPANDVIEGLAVLQTIYDHHELQIPVGDQLLASEFTVRETGHAPFRYVLGVSSVREDTTVADGPVYKTLSVKMIEGLATKRKTPKGWKAPKEDSFILSMSVDDGEHCQLPFVELCPKEGPLLRMEPRTDEPINNVLIFQLKTKHFGLVEKIRIGVEELTPGKSLCIHKMRLVETLSGTEVRFLIHSEFRDFEVLEVMCVYPDVAPRLSYQYAVQLHTFGSKGSFRPYINLVGTEGDSGFRAYPGLTEFPEDTTVQMDIEALNLGELKEVRVYVSTTEKISWTFDINVQCETPALLKWSSKKMKVIKAKDIKTASLTAIG